MSKILIAGCGDIGTRLGKRWLSEGHQVTGLKRHPLDAEDGIRYIKADIADAGALNLVETDFDLLCFIVSADGRNEASYRAVYETGLDNVAKRFGHMPWLFVSSTSVYGQTRGEWVDETSKTEPDNVNSRWIVRAERQVRALNPLNTIVRFSGIYGPGREHLVRLAAGRPAVQKSPPYYTNRIHQDDCVSVLAFLGEKRLAGEALDGCYLASDDDPAPMWDVVSWLAARQACPPPVEKTVESEASMNKRCSNARLKALGYRFRYAGYRDGYAWVGAS